MRPLLSQHPLRACEPVCARARVCVCVCIYVHSAPCLVPGRVELHHRTVAHRVKRVPVSSAAACAPRAQVCDQVHTALL